MTDDEIRKIEQTLARALASLEDSYIGSPLARERLEAAASEAIGLPIKFPDYDEKTGTLTKMVLYPPLKLDSIDVTVVLESGGEE
tara:strand:- start:18764 stop:19018 length:255 start_codon:yes stop_codon:yes gene_type:complete